MNEQLIQQAQVSGFYNLRFQPDLEQRFIQYQYQRTLPKLAPVNLIALAFFFLYSLVDYFIFPFEVASWTIPIRLFLVVPVILLATLVSYRTRSNTVFFSCYSASYTVAGLAVVAIIWIAHSKGIMVPYDGLFLVFSYGYFVMAIPFRSAVACSWLIYALYALAEAHAGLAPDVFYLNLFFLFCANLIGSVGAYIQEHNQRGNFLNLQLLKIRQQEAERENKSKTRFIAAASHDLRQPLNAMSLLMDGLQGAALNSLQSQQILSKLRLSLDQLNSLLGSLLDISRLNLGVIKPQMSVFDLHELAERIVVEFAEQVAANSADTKNAADTKLSVKTAMPQLRNDIAPATGIYSDPLLLERILRNLLSNAIKHAEASEIRLGAEVVQDDIRFVVADNGCGIPQKDHERVLQEFQQVRRHNGRPSSGLGLGLAIVQQLSSLMEIPMLMQSEEQQGTTFMFLIPAGDLENQPANESDELNYRLSVGVDSLPSIPSEQDLEELKIWLIEDDAANRDALSELFRQHGANVQHFSGWQSLEEFLESSQQSTDYPDLVLTDYRLGGIKTGLAAINLIREYCRARVPAIVLSADVEKIRSLEKGNEDYIFLSKPVSPAKLLLGVKRQLSRSDSTWRRPEHTPSDCER